MLEEYSYLGFPLCSKEVRQIAYEFAEDNGFEGFSKDIKEAGRKWFTFLLSRYPKKKSRILFAIFLLQGLMLAILIKLRDGTENMRMYFHSWKLLIQITSGI